MPPLSPSKQDYLEVIWLLGQQGRRAVSISAIAERLGVKRPSVTRTVQSLARGGYLRHRPRGLVALTEPGRRTAGMLHHIHRDLIELLAGVLGVPRQVAETDAAQIEHCLSAATARRLHAWLEMIDRMEPADRPVLRRRPGRTLFEGLPDSPSAGWRA